MNSIPECPGRSEYGLCVQRAAESIESPEAFRGAGILLTGSTGMVGGALARTLLYLNRVHGLGLTLLLPVRNEQALSRLPGIAGRREVKAFVCDLERKIELPEKVDFLIHAACPTASEELKNRSAEVSRTIALGTLNLLDLAVRKKPRGLVYLSSMEAYGAMDGKATEDKLGRIDLTSPRSCYPAGKRFSENAVACFAAEYGISACSARLAQVLGAGIKPGEKRAYACFARAALQGKDIVLRTKGISMGNYVHVSDAVAGILFLLMHGRKGEIYNLGGEDASVTVAAFAGRIADLLSNGKSKIVYDIPEDASSLPYAPDTGITLDTSKLKGLGFTGRFGLDDMILSLGKDIAESEQQ